MENNTASEKRWNATAYDDQHSFVWRYGEELIKLLAPRAGERMLDLGCGTGHLTNQIAAVGAEVIAIDKSTTMIEEARRLYPNLRFELADATDFHFDQRFNAVFSNAAIHWMKDQASVARCIWEALKPGGRFVAEFGGKGNIRAIRSALTEAVRAAGGEVSFEPFARYYPTIGEHATLLEAQGFRVGFASHFDRPTKLDGGEQGLRNWLLTFTDNIIESLSATMRETVIAEVERKLRPVLFRDGSWWADYRRIRIAALQETI